MKIKKIFHVWNGLGIQLNQKLKIIIYRWLVFYIPASYL
ncbi:hypothetical protein HMPREF1570_1195 [Klebsiella oxytoca KA-2]|nr:hypothetical protein HMPREF1570_1195 [Klebsiella oxytoca KA-2]